MYTTALNTMASTSTKEGLQVFADTAWDGDGPIKGDTLLFETLTLSKELPFRMSKHWKIERCLVYFYMHFREGVVTIGVPGSRSEIFYQTNLVELMREQCLQYDWMVGRTKYSDYYPEKTVGTLSAAEMGSEFNTDLFAKETWKTLSMAEMGPNFHLASSTSERVDLTTDSPHCDCEEETDYECIMCPIDVLVKDITDDGVTTYNIRIEFTLERNE